MGLLQKLKKTSVAEQIKMQNQMISGPFIDFLTYYADAASRCKNASAIQQDEEISYAFATYTSEAENEDWYRQTLQQGRQLLTIHPFPWQQIRMLAFPATQASYDESKTRQWVTNILRLLEAQVDQED